MSILCVFRNVSSGLAFLGIVVVVVVVVVVLVILLVVVGSNKGPWRMLELISYSGTQ